MIDTRYAIGLDTASDRWHAVVQDGYPGPAHGFCSQLKPHSSKKRENPWKDPDKRRARLCLDFLLFLATLEPGKVAIFCEEPLALAKNGKTTRLLGLAAGALWHTATQAGFEWHWVDVSHWKRTIVGNGNADKAKIREWVLENDHPGNEEVATYEAEPDLYDARCLKVYGWQTLRDGARPATL